MIYVKRPTEVPKALDHNEPTSHASIEFQAVLKIYDVEKFNPVYKFSSYGFSAYSKGTVKDDLRRMHHNKCAYCESNIAYAGIYDIEHFRPKGSVHGRHDHKGYYWMAAEWDNLLLACKLCNSKKRDQFPLKCETDRNMNHNETKVEKPLLINPCEEKNPEHFLLFSRDGTIEDRGTDEGRQSIDVYGLARPDLSKKRAEVVSAWARKLQFLEREHISWVRAFTQEEREEAESIILELYEELKATMNDEHEFAGMARQIVGPKLSNLWETKLIHVFSRDRVSS